jgi:hypothetical protein
MISIEQSAYAQYPAAAGLDLSSEVIVSRLMQNPVNDPATRLS